MTLKNRQNFVPTLILHMTINFEWTSGDLILIGPVVLCGSPK